MKRRWVVILVGAVLAVGLAFLGLSSRVDGTYRIPTVAMSPTLSPGEKTVLRDIEGDVRRGDIVIAETEVPAKRQRGQLGALGDKLPADVVEQLAPPAPETVKQVLRVVGVGGDHVEAVDGKLRVNGNPADEPFLRPGTSTFMKEPVDVPAGHVFLMGDNRADARDSRVYGPVSLESVESRVTFRYWPLGKLGGL